MTTRSTSASAASDFEIGCVAREPRGRGARADDQRAGARQRRGDRIRQAECEEVRLWIGTQHAERQHDDASERLRQRPRAVAVRCSARRAAPRPSHPQRLAAPRVAWPARGE